MGPALSLAPPGVPWRPSILALHPGALAEDGGGRLGFSANSNVSTSHPRPPPTSLPALQVLESQLQRPLPEDLAEALANGVILCQLANQLRPRSVPFIHVPSPAVVSWCSRWEVGNGTGDFYGPSFTLFFFSFLTHPQPKLSTLKSRKNVESFLEACRKMGVPEVWGGVFSGAWGWSLL